MNVILSTWNRFHFFDLAEQLNCLNSLQYLCTTLPRYRAEKDIVFNVVDKEKLRTYPYFFVMQILLGKIFKNTWLTELAAVVSTKTYQNHVKKIARIKSLE